MSTNGKHDLALQCREEGPVVPVKQLQILRRRVPPIEQDRPRFKLLVVDGIDEHLVKVIILSLAVHVRGIHPIVNRVEVLLLACAVDEADDDDPPASTWL